MYKLLPNCYKLLCIYYFIRYDDAKEAKLSRMSKHQQSFGARGGHRNTFNENSEKTTYIGLVNHLQKNVSLINLIKQVQK